MLRSLFRHRDSRREQGQALVLFAFGLVVFLGLVGLSVDVGRFLWARTSIQNAVDAAALAAAQSMPDQANAEAKANEYWAKNSSFIRSQGSNVDFNVTFPVTANDGVQIHAQADIDTWFAKFVGLSHWSVSADAAAASTYLDISLVLDVSGSTCWGSYPPVTKTSNQGPFGTNMGPGRTADKITLTAAITSSATSITVNNGAMFSSTSYSSKFGGGGKSYLSWNPGGSDQAGIIQIDNEIMKITKVSGNTLTVQRGLANTFLGTSGVATTHAAGSTVLFHHSGCNLSAPSASGPFDYADTIEADANHFISLFNPNFDRIGVTTFSAQGSILSNLTSGFTGLQNSIAALGAPNGGTNAPHGLAVGRMVLNGSGKRSDSTRVLVFLTDGIANTYCGGSYSQSAYNSSTSCSGGGGADDASHQSRSKADAIKEAQRLINEYPNRTTLIYTIGVGPYVEDSFLEQIASIGGGRYFKAPTPADLDAAFTSVAQQTHIALTR